MMTSTVGAGVLASAQRRHLFASVALTRFDVACRRHCLFLVSWQCWLS